MYISEYEDREVIKAKNSIKVPLFDAYFHYMMIVHIENIMAESCRPRRQHSENI
jgi:hypothetical protein